MVIKVTIYWLNSKNIYTSDMFKIIENNFQTSAQFMMTMWPNHHMFDIMFNDTNTI